MKNLSVTAIIEKSPDGWYVGQLEEFPAVMSQGRTIDELKDNLLDAFKLVMEAEKEKTKQQYKGRTVLRRKITFA